MQPDSIPEYKASLTELTEPENFKLLAQEPGRVVEARELTEAEAEMVADRAHIVAVEPDQTAHAVEPEVSPDAVRMSAEDAARMHRIDKVSGKGKGRVCAVIDTGISEELYARYKNRVIGRYDVFDNEDWRDLKSLHGSWCISAIAGNATECEILSYKGLSTKDGSGSYSGIIDCIEHARKQKATDISMSLGGPASDIMDRAVNAAAAQGINVYVAAGNDQRGTTEHKANGQSPARASGAVCVAASDSDELVADFSNIGSVVDIAGAGVAVQCPDSDLLPRYMSGTSMATPHVCATAVCAGVSGKELVQSARDTGEPAVAEGSGIADAERAIKKTASSEPKPEPRRPREDLQRVSLYRFGEGTIRKTVERGDCVITVGRKREELAVVRLIGRFR